MKTFKRINDGIDRPVPKEGFGRYIRLLGMHFWKLVWISAMLLVLSIPVVTIPAALCAANRVCIKLIREGNVFPWHEFWKEFKAELFRALLPGLLFAVIIAAAYYFMSLGLSNSDLPLWSVIFWTVGIVAAYLGFTWGTYTFSLMTMQALPVARIMKNALILVNMRPAYALASAGIIVLNIALVMVLFPMSVFLLIFLLGLMCYTLSFLVNSLANEYIISEEQL